MSYISMVQRLKRPVSLILCCIVALMAIPYASYIVQYGFPPFKIVNLSTGQQDINYTELLMLGIKPISQHSLLDDNKNLYVEQKYYNNATFRADTEKALAAMDRLNTMSYITIFLVTLFIFLSDLLPCYLSLRKAKVDNALGYTGWYLVENYIGLIRDLPLKYYFPPKIRGWFW